MSRKKSITLLTVILVIIALLLAMTFARFSVPWYKNGVYNYNSILQAVDLDADLEEGYAYTLTLSEDSEEPEDIETVLKTLNDRLSALGYTAFSVTASAEADADYQIRIQIKMSESADSDVKAVAAYGELVFADGNKTEIMSGKDGVADAYYGGSYIDEDSSEKYYVVVKLNDYGYDKIVSAIDAASASSESEAFKLQLVLGDDYDNPLLAASEITKDNILEKTITITSATKESAKQIALQISTGGLAYQYEVGEVMSANPLLGENVSTYVIVTFALLAALLMAAFIVLYRGYGIMASISLLSFILLEVFFLIAVPGVTVSLASVIGILFATFLTADGLFVVIKRIRDEYAKGKTVKASVKAGYKRSSLAILNVDVITGIVALALFIFCSGAIKAFAITFGIGVLVSAFTTILLSQLLVKLILPLPKNQEAFFRLEREDA